MDEMKSSPVAVASLSELRMDRSMAAQVGFSDPCPCCGSKKRRCLHPPTGSRKKLLVLDSSPAPSPPLPQAAPLPSSAAITSPPGARASLASSPSTVQYVSPFARSTTFPPSRSSSPSFRTRLDAVFQSSPPMVTGFASRSSDPISPMSPPQRTPIGIAPPPMTPTPTPESRLEKSSSSVNESGLVEKAVMVKEEQEKVGGAGAEEKCMSAGRESVKVSLSCRCGAFREILLSTHDESTRD